MKKTRTIWTKEQEQYLIDHYIEFGAMYCATQLQKTPTSVRLRAQKLGIKRYKTWDYTESSSLNNVLPNESDKFFLIQQLKNKGLSTKQIAQQLQLRYSEVYYHLNPEYRARKIIQNRLRKHSHPYISKLMHFKQKTNLKTLKASSNEYQIYSKIYGFTGGVMNFTYKDVINKFGETPVCYLTGQTIDISKPDTFSFDHKIPRSRGGENTLDNLGICTAEVNQAKRDKTPEEFIELCQAVVQHNITNCAI